MSTSNLSRLRFALAAALAALLLANSTVLAEPTANPRPVPDARPHAIPIPQGNLTLERLRPPPPVRDLVAEDPVDPGPGAPIPWSEAPAELAFDDTTHTAVIWPCAEGFTCCSDTETDACTHFANACAANGGHGDSGPGWATCTFD